MITINDLESAVVTEIRENSEQVIALVDEAYVFGTRGHTLYVLWAALGRFTILDDGRVFHSLAGSRPCWNEQEWTEYVEKRRQELTTLSAISFSSK